MQYDKTQRALDSLNSKAHLLKAIEYLLAICRTMRGQDIIALTNEIMAVAESHYKNSHANRTFPSCSQRL